VHLAHYDAVTDLPNRVLLMDRLNQLTKAAQRRKSKVAVIFIDLDRFKEVNDSLGHDAGDLLLQTLAGRLSNAVRGEDTVARMGGDEFVVVFQGFRDVQDIAVLAQKLLSRLEDPVTLNGYELVVTASMGISLYPDDATNGQEMIRNADAAMYQSKGAGGNACQFYTSDLNQRALEMLSMENALRRAIERQEFVLYYQPQVDIASGSVVGAEALIRWNHPDLGLVMPGKFISIAEERGLIVPIGSWVIEEAARQAAVWRNSGRLSIPIAVNVSAVQFRQKDFVERLENSVRKHGITPNCIELELTESIVMRDAEATVEILKRLHEMGFQLSIDDFGTGYSSLGYLRRFPIDKIKIDQSFVTDESAGGIVTAIIGLARSLKLKAIAEGVQTNQQLEILREQHCDEAQGFLFSPALASEEFEKLVRQWNPEHLGFRVEPSR
jgi:diguanylate cyclase (GGDEF)-like protein